MPQVTEEKPGVVAGAAGAVWGQIKGLLTGAVVGGAILAAAAAAVALVGVPLLNHFAPEMAANIVHALPSISTDPLTAAAFDPATIKAATLPDISPALAGGFGASTPASALVPVATPGLAIGSVVGWLAAAGGVIGALGGSVTGGIAGAASGWMNTRKLEGDGSEVAKAQEKQLAYANGLVQGATMAKMETMEQEVGSTQWQERCPPKAQPEQYVQMVRDQQAQTVLAGVKPQGHA